VELKARKNLMAKVRMKAGPVTVPMSGGFYYDRHHDTNDEKPWNDMDIRDLRASLEHGSTLEEAASFLCRAGTVEEVRKKADELGLTYRRDKTLRPSSPSPVKTVKPAGPKVHRWKGRLVRDKVVSTKRKKP
jgi:hypothetical protein